MPSTLSPQQFVAKWRSSTLKERSAAQEHFIDLCHMVGHETPAEADATGATFTFEAGAAKMGGGDGFADVWKRGYFAWEYKGKHADLDKAYDQLLKYREALENPPILVVSDMDSIVIHTNFTNTVKRVETLTLDDLLDPHRLDLLRSVFLEPERLRTAKTTAQVTTEAAAHFARLAELLRQYGEEPPRVAHFLIRLLFCLFAEDINLLPDGLFSELVTRTRLQPKAFAGQLGQLFSALATGGWFGSAPIPHVDGGLFDDAPPLELDTDGMEILSRVCDLDWSSIEPSIFGTLFERSLDPDKRQQLGAHYTSRDDILLVVEPVLMAPWRKRWEEVQQEARALAAQRDAAETGQRARANRQDALRGLLDGFCSQLANVTVLDPACGSGNFLYVALRQLLDLWKEVSTLATELGLPAMLHMEGFAPGPAQLHGIEVNPYAHELAQTTVWIGYLQWRHENGFGFPSPPILKPLHTVARRDAVLAYDAAGTPVEPEWPAVDVIIGNPPFLGGKLLRSGLGDAYVDDLFRLYDGRVPREADYVCYWFERARAAIDEGRASRAGLLATQGIRGGANRRVLQRIKDTGGIFMAWSDREWVLDGANVNVSIIGFDDGGQTRRTLDGRPVPRILTNLTSAVDITRAVRLRENAGIAFMGDTKVGAFEVDGATARALLAAEGNPNGRPNSDVVVPWVNGLDITRRPRGMWIIDFGTDMSEETAAQYERPFEYVRAGVYPERSANRRACYRTNWWIHAEARPALRKALLPLSRYIATPTVSKHRLFVWLQRGMLPDHQLIAIARCDDYSIGVVHSRPHEVWSLRQGTRLQSRPRYTPTTTFETFPFPWPPGKEPVDDPRYCAIAEAAKDLIAQRDAWLDPPGFPEQDLQQRTLTNLYNRNPTWLQLAHRRLDEAVFDAYGWPHDLDDDALLERLLELNLARAEEG